eukprot:TRINITY_DN8976_c0_g1_i1.p1 TRINITY_DN8976_c0_g1~~TRINITY_DN8976_c0_g1_i1.p1  ORF type:complete len:204 (-),score=40.68 TRINITY_DN8976_c0_g1_i1:90-701(-)
MNRNGGAPLWLIDAYPVLTEGDYDIIDQVPLLQNDERGQRRENLVPADEDFNIKTLQRKLGLTRFYSTRPASVTSTMAVAYFQRSMKYLRTFIPDQDWLACENESQRRYREFQPQGSGKNKCRHFWNQIIDPMLQAVNLKELKRVALIGSLNGLTPTSTQDFFTLLLVITNTPDQDAHILLQAVCLVAAVQDRDPFQTKFPHV